MNKLLTLITILALTGVAVAGPGAIAGTVTDRATGDPIGGAIVTAKGTNGVVVQTQTSRSGAYRIDNLRPGDYRVHAAARGYEPAGYPGGVTVPPDQVVRGIDFQLVPAVNPRVGAIAGKIVCRRTREPIRGAVVAAHGPNGRGAARTDGHGNYLIRGLPAGEYRVGAKARYYQHEVYPGAVTVQAGEVTRDINLALTPKPRKGAIAGRVLEARTGRPIARAVVLARGEHGVGRAVTDARGFYRIKGLNPGRYEVAAVARGYERAIFLRPVPVQPGEVTRGVDFELRRHSIDSY